MHFQLILYNGKDWALLTKTEAYRLCGPLTLVSLLITKSCAPWAGCWTSFGLWSLLSRVWLFPSEEERQRHFLTQRCLGHVAHLCFKKPSFEQSRCIGQVRLLVTGFLTRRSWCIFQGKFQVPWCKAEIQKNLVREWTPLGFMRSIRVFG